MKFKSIKTINKISIIGLGYVGLPLAINFGKIFKTVGFELDENKVTRLKKNFRNPKKLELTSKKNEIKNSDYFIVTVQTPIKKNNKPDLSYLISATKMIGKYLNKGNIVIFESTVYPGVTEDICGKLLEKVSKLKINKDFYVGFSPERISPGDRYDLTKINKLVSGSNKFATNQIKELYKNIINAKIYTTENIKIAELSKLIENAQRDINISFMNEVSLICDKLKIETSSVLKAASTKWNFIKFKPGLVGGHCISVDPFYLTHIAKKKRYNPRVILSGRSINDQMGFYVGNKLLHIIKKNNINNPKVGILGLTFKENCSDFRGSKVFDIIKLLRKKRISFDIFDPKIKDYELKKTHPNINNQKLTGKYDILIISVAHSEFKKIKIEQITKILKNKDSYLFDLKSIYKKKLLRKKNINYWSL